MFKKEEAPAPTPAPRPEAAPRPEPTASRGAAAERATIGRSITIKGEVTGDEDLLIQGRVEGSVNLKQHAVTIGPEGEVKASIAGRIVTVEGRVEGNLSAEEQVILRSSSSVEGDITAPRVVLEDGARFRGGVDMGEEGGRAARSGVGASQARKGTEPGRSPTGALEASPDREKSATGTAAGLST